jgi:GT2 family glycosyltransferase
LDAVASELYLVEPIVSAPPRGDGIAVSVVSHGQRELVEPLLHRLASAHDPLVRQVIVTHNLREPRPLQPPSNGWPFEFTEIFNELPAGFGANHNRAFAACRRALFCVLNPDIELVDPGVWSALVRALDEPRAGCAYPVLLNADGTTQDSEREAVTPLSLWRRHVRKRASRRTDWVSGAFLLVPATVWSELAGFDERFVMYCEDVDFCLRLQLAGRRLVRAEAKAVHGAARASRRPGRRMAWHVLSLLRLWLQPPLWRYAFSAKARQ